MVKLKKYVQDFEAQLTARIEKIEAQSSVEVVPALHARAESYSLWAIGWATTLALVFYWMSLRIDLWMPYIGLYKVVAALLVWRLSFGIFSRTLVLAYLLPGSVRQAAAFRKAESVFLRNVMGQTRDATGILIAVFEFEKTVVVMADEGFKNAVPSTYWRDLGATLAKDFSRQHAGQEFFAALQHLEVDLLSKFPRRPDDTNELSDKLIRE